ncbi:hypothetical protein [Candidatus Amarolinea dominans]|uniref:hypothetical protein n=1 Tax=Candidatus Amarolinea dominans TaxID=3140696 RepID=UPI003134B308|nr:hypothetical protein [Anaerolineae bacterium]
MDEAHWLNVDEIAHGRLSRNNNNANPTRYDQGIAYSERKVRDALAEAVTRVDRLAHELQLRRYAPPHRVHPAPRRLGRGPTPIAAAARRHRRATAGVSGPSLRHHCPPQQRFELSTGGS